jgi:hypothetical protein
VSLAGHLFLVRVLQLEEETSVDIECTITVLILDKLILAELAYGQTILEGYDEVLIHNESQTTTHCYVRTVGCAVTRTSHILVIRGAILRLALE